MTLEVKNLSVSYRDRVILKDISFKINQGEILAIRGANGSGKSTLCTAIAGVLKNYGFESTGSISVNGQRISELSVSERCLRIGVIFQNPDNHLICNSVDAELSFALENLCVSKDDIKERVKDTLELIGISGLKDKSISELSGGEKQLVQIASVLTMQSNFIIADEITSRIDKERSYQIRNILKSLKQNNIGVLLISHNKEDIEIADRIYTLEGGMFHD